MAMTYQQLADTYPLAYESLRSQNEKAKYKMKSMTQSISFAMGWYNTVEGENFWDDVYTNTPKSITNAKKAQPHLFTITSKRCSSVAMKILHISGE
jgi:hypothetical protein